MERSTMTPRLTDTEARKALAPKQGQRFIWDDEVKGFALRVTFTGAKAFILDYRADGRQRRITIGSFPDWSVASARKAASDMKRDVDLGKDPMGEKHDQRNAPTMNDLWERYKEEHLRGKSERSQKDEISMWNNIILPSLGKDKVCSIAHEDIDKLHRDITEIRKTPVRANRTIEVLRKAFNLAKRWKWINDNPASGVRRNAEEKRERYLNKTEIAALAVALSEHPEQITVNAIKLLMLTGARKSEVTGATWDMFDLENGIWTKPSAHTKQRKLHRVPLSAPALNLLKEIKRQVEVNFAEARRKDKTAKASPFVFPSDVSPDQPIQEIRRTWITVCRAAGLTEKIPKKNRAGKPMKDKAGQIITIDWPSVRIHDLRHSFASILVSAGASLPLIGQMLGHTQVQTTQRYAHLYDDPLRKAAEMVGEVIMPAPAQIEGPKEKKGKDGKKKRAKTA
jgi:integrase